MPLRWKFINKERKKELTPPNKHTKLLQSVMERTAILEAQTQGPEPMERVQMLENTKKFKAPQKEYERWQEKISTRLEN
eukprot:10388838-Ditylum_brightwellii.AAC.1